DEAGVLVGMVRAAGGGDASTGKQRIRRRSALVGVGVRAGTPRPRSVRVRRLSHGRSRRARTPARGLRPRVRRIAQGALPEARDGYERVCAVGDRPKVIAERAATWCPAGV